MFPHGIGSAAPPRPLLWRGRGGVYAGRGRVPVPAGPFGPLPAGFAGMHAL